MSEATQQIKSTLLAATRATNQTAKGLLTIQIDCPLYVWTEILTHRRFARNASSARAMSTQRYADMGYYEPSVFYTQGNGMQASNEPIAEQMGAIMIWRRIWLETTQAARQLELLGVAKEQRNRVIPPYKIIRAIVTGTESAWRAFLSLRNSHEADTAMQVLAQSVHNEILHAQWSYGSFHFPYNVSAEDVATLAETIKCPHTTARIIINVARCARVSYARVKGKSDYELYQSLLTSGHMSPFEHIAVWGYNPDMSCYTCTPDDIVCYDDTKFPRCNFSGWWNYRAMLDSNNSLVDMLQQ